MPDNVTGLAWAGNSLLCAVPDGYYVLRPSGHSAAQHGLSSPTAAGAAAAGGVQYELALLADHLTAINPLLGCIPDLRLALMAWEDNMVLVTDAAGEDIKLHVSLLLCLCLLGKLQHVTELFFSVPPAEHDSDAEHAHIPTTRQAHPAPSMRLLLHDCSTGAAVREPLQLPLPPLALASAGLFVVAVCDDGVYVFDRNSSRQVQQMEYAHDDAYVGLTQRLPAAADAGGRCICLATSSQVLWLEPVALEQQVGTGAGGPRSKGSRPVGAGIKVPVRLRRRPVYQNGVAAARLGLWALKPIPPPPFPCC